MLLVLIQEAKRLLKLRSIRLAEIATGERLQECLGEIQAAVFVLGQSAFCLRPQLTFGDGAHSTFPGISVRTPEQVAMRRCVGPGVLNRQHKSWPEHQGLTLQLEKQIGLTFNA
jgi:hypothetical protein